MVRRLAKQSRDDIYASKKDYQVLHEQATITLLGKKSLQKLELLSQLVLSRIPVVGFGGYFKPSTTCKMGLTIIDSGKVLIKKQKLLSDGWNRFGVAFDYDREVVLHAVLEFDPPIKSISLWGIDLGYLSLVENIEKTNPSGQSLSQSHLAPETFYFLHDSPIALKFNSKKCDPFQTTNQSNIILKKCSYCGRLLPLDPDHLGVLAFHKHNAKKTNHQNECRACKKWRINDSFNEKRTIDQLHESSVITRERKIFLREPAILYSIKDRDGAGLKSIIWNRFNKKCFKCKKPLKLQDVQLDHTRPMAYLWPIDEHATCLCAECNNHKKEKFPIDFYTKDEIVELSRITGLSIIELSVKSVNRDELNRILENVAFYARTWEPRTFKATARKIFELEPNINLFQILEEIDREGYEWLLSELEKRPPSVGDQE